jgi:hypothetical protein
MDDDDNDEDMMMMMMMMKWLVYDAYHCSPCSAKVTI